MHYHMFYKGFPSYYGILPAYYSAAMFTVYSLLLLAVAMAARNTQEWGFAHVGSLFPTAFRPGRGLRFRNSRGYDYGSESGL